MTIIRKRVYITVKTYPVFSRTYDELVCTTGILEDGSWIRLYPIPFRKDELKHKYSKYTWINVDVVKNTSDPRPESFRPIRNNDNSIAITVEDKPKSVNWNFRKGIIFKNQKIYTNRTELLNDKKQNNFSLAIFKPTKIIDFFIEPVDCTQHEKRLEEMKSDAKQITLWQNPDEFEKEFTAVDKLPYKFSYKFEDNKGQISKFMIEDWEIGALYWKMLKQAKGNEEIAKQKVREQYMENFSLGKKDLHFFLGTTRLNHYKPNPFTIIGVFYPPHNNQLDMFDLM